MHFGKREDGRQFVLSWRTNESQAGPVTLQGMLKQQLDAAEGNGEGATRELALIAQVEEILTQVVFSNVRGIFLDVVGEAAGSAQIGFLGPSGQSSQLHVLLQTVPNH